VEPCAQRRKVWLAPTALVPCSNAANIGECKTWRTKSKFSTWQNSVTGQQSPKCINSLPAQETAKHRAKFGWLPMSDVAAVMKPRSESRWNLLGCPKPANWSQLLADGSSPCCGDMWRRHCCLTCFFRLSIRALVAKIQPDKVVRWCPDGDFLRHFCYLYFQRTACSTFQTCILNLH